VHDGLFEGEEAVSHLIEHIVGPLGIRVDESSPWADARLPAGSRVQTRFLRAHFNGTDMTNDALQSDLLHDAVDMPAVGDALQLVLSTVLKFEAGARDKVLHRP
jgi:hypothetical protein